MNKYFPFFALALLFHGCASSDLTDDKKINSYLANYSIPENLDAIYVFDEYSCNLCSENIFQDIKFQAVENDYVILFSLQNIDNYDFSQTPLMGYVDEEKVIPISSELITHLREKTNTYMGNYKVTLSSTKIINIDKF